MAVLFLNVCYQTLQFPYVGTSKKSLLRLLGLFAGLLGMAVAGSQYGFNAFSDALKKQLSLKQSEVELISSVGNIGTCIGFTAGLFVQRFPAQLSSCIAALLTFAGYFLMAASVDKTISTNVPLLCFYFFVVGQGSIFTYMVCLVHNAANFSPTYRGTIIGVVDSMYGASAAIFSAIYGRTFGADDNPADQNVAGFLYTIAAVAAGVNLFVFVTLWSLPWKEDKKDADNVSVNEDGDVRAESFMNGESASVQQHSVGQGKRKLDLSGDFRHVSPVTEFSEGGTEDSEKLIEKECKSLEQPELTIRELFVRLDFYLLFFLFTIGTSVGLMFMNNVLFILDSFPEKKLRTQYGNLFTIILPIASAVARLVCGVLSDSLHRFIPRIYFVVLFLVPFTAAQILLRFWPSDFIVLLANVIFVGVAYGSLWCLTPTILSEMGGLRNFGVTWGVVMLASALTGMGYQAIYGKVYDDHIHSHGPTVEPVSTGSRTCYGSDCYSTTIDVAAASCVLVLLSAIILAWRTRTKWTLKKAA